MFILGREKIFKISKHACIVASPEDSHLDLPEVWSGCIVFVAERDLNLLPHPLTIARHEAEKRTNCMSIHHHCMHQNEHVHVHVVQCLA